jgi:CheY-like chemotaxis protein
VWLAVDARTPSERSSGNPDGESDGDVQRASCILVVDDADDHRAALCSLLEEAGYRVEDASHGRDALDRLLAGLSPDLILLDLFMPVMDGWALWQEIKTHPVLAPIPIVVMSGYGEAVLNSAPVSAGYLRKPLERSQLLETIASCLWRHRRRRSGTRPVGVDGEPANEQVSGGVAEEGPATKR